MYPDDYPTDVYDNNSLLYPIVENYVIYLNTKLSEVAGSLLTYRQLENLGCSVDERSCPSELIWLYNTSYWTGVADSANLWFMDSGYLGTFEFSVLFGVRPVITISTSEL